MAKFSSLHFLLVAVVAFLAITSQKTSAQDDGVCTKIFQGTPNPCIPELCPCDPTFCKNICSQKFKGVGTCISTEPVRGTFACGCKYNCALSPLSPTAG